MAMGSIEFTTISRAQEYTTIKHNEDNKAFVDQSHIGQQLHKQVDQKTKQVQSGDDTEWLNRKFDAKDKGSNEFQGEGGKNRKKDKSKDKVVVKGKGGFDIKV